MKLISSPKKSFLEFLCHLFDKQEIDERRKTLRARHALFERRKAGDEEFCNGCFASMGFSKKRAVDDPIRYRNGATYNPAGQFCPTCNRGQPA